MKAAKSPAALSLYSGAIIEGERVINNNTVLSSPERSPWDLSFDEQLRLRNDGVHSGFADFYRENDPRFPNLTERGVEITEVKNVDVKTGGKVIDGYMAVRVTPADAPDSHWHFEVRYNGDNPTNSPDEHIAALGSIALARPPLVKGVY